MATNSDQRRWELGIEAAIEYADQLLYDRTGRHLSDLQSCIIQQSWQGHTYGQVATSAGYSEGHIKDVASQLWRALSEALGERITKGNLRSRLINRIKRTLKSSAARPPSTASTADVALAPRPHLTETALPHFIGRKSALESLTTLFQSHRLIVIQGEGGIGKTTLAQQYVQRFDQVLELLMAKEPANITPVESVVEEWLRQNFNEEPGREFGVTLSRLKRHLQTKQIGILIDNLEPALDGNGQFLASHRRYVELLRVLTLSSAQVIMTSRDRLCEPGINVYHYRLPGLSLASWQQFFDHCHTEHPSDSSQTAALRKMHRAYGGNAKAMEILCAAVTSDFEGDLSAYWQENSTDLLGTADVRNLVASQVNRLAKLDADAYRVFLRLGCYRYQDQPRLRSAAITALMWDIAPQRQRQILNSLRNRSLLECCKGDYWLHPVSRAEAIARLRQSEDWQQANRAAADYWSDRVCAIVSLEDALQALEAYYHLIAAEDYDAAAAGLLRSRHNQWQQFLPLASNLYRMGLLQPVINAITQVLPRVNKGRSELNNILGDVYWITGRIHSAIACQQQTLSYTQQALDQQLNQPPHQPLCEQAAIDKTATDKNVDKNAYYLKMLTVDAYLSIGLYCIDLWELTQAAEQFEQVIALAAKSAHQAWADKATVGLALVRAYLGESQTARHLAHSLYAQFTVGPTDRQGRSAYFLQLLGQVFNCLSELDKAEVLYQRAITFAETGHYIQVKAKALTGLAVVQRQRQDYEGALKLHTQAVALCETIGAKCDLAEAHFQFGLSVEEHLKATSPSAGLSVELRDRHFAKHFAKHFESAIALFSDIQAPQQVTRVRSHTTPALGSIYRC
ncbi:MAG: NB-ARC domain-containing protein [Phormidesmis sp.]